MHQIFANNDIRTQLAQVIKSQNKKNSTKKRCKSKSKYQRTQKRLCETTQYQNLKIGLNNSHLHNMPTKQQQSTSRNFTKDHDITKLISERKVKQDVKQYKNKVIELTSVNEYIKDKVQELQHQNIQLVLKTRQIKQQKDGIFNEIRQLKKTLQEKNQQISKWENFIKKQEIAHNQQLHELSNKYSLLQNKNRVTIREYEQKIKQKEHLLQQKFREQQEVLIKIKQQSKRQKNQLRTQIQNLKEEIKRNKLQKQNFLKELIDIKSKFEHIKNINRELQNDIDTKTKKYQELIVLKQSKQVQIISLQKQIQKNRLFNQDEHKKLDNFNKKISQENQNLKMTIKKYEQSINDIKTKLEEIKIKKLEVDNKLIKKQNQLINLKNNSIQCIEKQMNRIKVLQQQIIQKNNKFKNFQDRIQLITEDNKIYKSNIKQNQETISKLLIQLKEKEYVCKNSESKNDQIPILQSKIEQLQKQNKEISQELQQVSDYVQNYYTKIYQVEMYLSLQNKIRDSLEQKLDYLEQQNIIKQNYCNNQINLKSKLFSTNQIYQKCVKQSEQKIHQLENQIQRLKSELLNQKENRKKTELNLKIMIQNLKQKEAEEDCLKEVTERQKVKNDYMENEINRSGEQTQKIIKNRLQKLNLDGRLILQQLKLEDQSQRFIR